MSGASQQTQTGEIKGKFGYMAPEQINGSPVTRAADIYAAGVVLWEALSGVPLFNAERRAARRAGASRQPLPAEPFGGRRTSDLRRHHDVRAPA